MNFDEIIVKESPGLCRCCLSEGCYKDLGKEHSWMGETEVYADILLECFDISISQHNEGPNGANRLICEVCITRLRDACNFKKQVQESEKKFVDMVGRGEFKPKVHIIYQPPLKAEEVEAEEAPGDADVEYLDEDIDFGDVDESVSRAAPARKRGRPRKGEPKPPRKLAKLVKAEEKTKSSKQMPKDECAQGPYQSSTSERRRESLATLFNNTTVMPFKWRGSFICYFCGKNYTEYPEFRKHTHAHGPCTTKDTALKAVKGNHVEIKIDVSEVTCELCNKEFQKFTDVIDHLVDDHHLVFYKFIDIPLQEYRLSDLRCIICEEQFTYLGHLINHVNKSHPANCFICDDCGVVCNKKRDLALHIREFHRPGGYPCDQCFKNFESRRLLSRHHNSHFRKCTCCGVKFSSLGLLKKHVQMHSQNGITKCLFCSKEFRNTSGLAVHLRSCELKTEIVPDTSVGELSMEPRKTQNVVQIRRNIQCVLNMSTAVPFKFFSKFMCFYCSKRFVEFDDLREHTVSEHPVCDLKSKSMRKCKGERITVKIDVSLLSCKNCLRPMESLEALIDHVISEHAANYDKSLKDCLEPFKIVKDSIPCPLCDSVFRYFAILLRHLNSDHNNNNRICDFCGKGFRSVTNLNVHVSHVHTGSCECEICGLKFKNQWCLARHRAKSHDAKEFKCPECPEQFQSQYQKQKHLIKAHDIGHKCSYCDRMFTRNSFMKDHIRRTHLKEKNVPCSVCNEKFFDNYLLRMHMVKHKGERKFSCEVCDKAFLRRSNLASHMDMHKKYGHVQN